MSEKDSFLSMFKMVDPNRKFLPIKIRTYYYVLGHLLRTFPISIGKSEIDMRDGFGCCVASGYGKQSVNNVINEIGKHLELDCSSYTSLHQEQLVGKKGYDKDLKKEINVKGYLNSDFLIKDDALSLLNGKEYAGARDYLMACANVYGKNWITKRLTGQEKKDELRYLGNASFVYFIQPNEKIIGKNLASGYFRRYSISGVTLTKEEKEEMDERRFKEEHKSNPEEWFEFLSFIRNIRNITYININNTFIDMIINKNKEYNNNEYILLDNIYTSNSNKMIKFAYINSLLRYHNANKPNKAEIELEVTEEDIKQAIEDYEIIYKSIKDFVVENSSDEINHEVDKEILLLLMNKRCFDEKSSSMSSDDVIKKISCDLDIPYNTVKGRFYGLKKEKKIETKPLQYTSKVWIITGG